MIIKKFFLQGRDNDKKAIIGREQVVDVKAGSVGGMKGHIHIGENIGDTNTDVILVELKEDRTLDKTEKDLKQVY